MLTETTLKKQLRSIVENEYEVPDQIEPFQFALEMLAHIGSTDNELRDDFIYSTLWTWIDGDIFDVEQLRHFLSVLMDKKHLFNRIGEQQTDSVFARAFSALSLQPILSVHRRKPFLTGDEVREIKKKILLYFNDERDIRGYVKDKGWAHAVAHTADLLDELGQCEELGQSDLAEILYAISGKVGVKESVYACEEDERMVTAVISIFNRELLTELEIKEWLSSFMSTAQITDILPESVYQFVNIKNFLRSLYFRVLEQEKFEYIRQATNAVLCEISRF